MQVGLLLVPEQRVEERVDELRVGDHVVVGEDGLDEDSNLPLPALGDLLDLRAAEVEAALAEAGMKAGN